MRQFSRRVEDARHRFTTGPKQEKRAPVQQPLPTPPRAIYSDSDVCRIMGLHGRKLVEARTKKTRGVDWDVVGHQAGMTAAWITRMQPNLAEGLKVLQPVPEDNTVWTVTVVSQTKNPQALLVRDTDNQPLTAYVHDASLWRPGDQFNAVQQPDALGRPKLVWTSKVNPKRYY